VIEDVDRVRKILQNLFKLQASSVGLVSRQLGGEGGFAERIVCRFEILARRLELGGLRFHLDGLHLELR
jgi:hypothetical protein